MLNNIGLPNLLVLMMVPPSGGATYFSALAVEIGSIVAYPPLGCVWLQFLLGGTQ